VKLGEEVKAGQLLAQLDTADLELALRQADIALRQAQSQARQLDEGPSASDLAAAEAALASAQAAYQELLKGSDRDQLAAARASVEQARVAVEQAQQAYDKIKDVPGASMLPQSQQLQQATINYETAQAQYRVTARGANQAQIAQGQAQIAQAQAALDKLKKGPTKEQKEIAQASVDQAQVALEQAQRRLANARVTAPWPGVLTAVNAVQGTLAQPGAPAFQLADLNRFHIDVQVDEVDIANLAEGQRVTIEVDALPEQKLTGAVASIAPTAQTSATTGTTYKVRIDMDPTDLPLRAGMSATATITSSARDNVLLVPNRAVQRDRETSKTFVERLVQGVPQQVEVRLGLRDEQQSEVRAGLEEGDQIAIRKVSSLQKLQQTFSGFGQ
jgi:HlyD family secretion protein